MYLINPEINENGRKGFIFLKDPKFSNKRVLKLIPVIPFYWKNGIFFQ